MTAELRCDAGMVLPFLRRVRPGAVPFARAAGRSWLEWVGCVANLPPRVGQLDKETATLRRCHLPQLEERIDELFAIEERRLRNRRSAAEVGILVLVRCAEQGVAISEQ